MRSKCSKNNEVPHCMAHEPQASVSLMFLPYFDVLCDVLPNRPTATWNLCVLYNDQKEKKRPIQNLPRWSVRGFGLVKAFFLSSKRYFLSLLLLFFFILIAYSFFEKFFNVFSCSKQNDGENICKTASLS